MRMRAISAPGSMTMASWVRSSPRMVQLQARGADGEGLADHF